MTGLPDWLNGTGWKASGPEMKQNIQVLVSVLFISKKPEREKSGTLFFKCNYCNKWRGKTQQTFWPTYVKDLIIVTRQISSRFLPDKTQFYSPFFLCHKVFFKSSKIIVINLGIRWNPFRGKDLQWGAWENAWYIHLVFSFRHAQTLYSNRLYVTLAPGKKKKTFSEFEDKSNLKYWAKEPLKRFRVQPLMRCSVLKIHH